MARNGFGGFSDGDDGYVPAIVAAAVLRIRIRIRDPGLGAFLTPGSGIRDSGWEKVSIQIRDPG